MRHPSPLCRKFLAVRCYAILAFRCVARRGVEGRAEASPLQSDGFLTAARINRGGGGRAPRLQAPQRMGHPAELTFGSQRNVASSVVEQTTPI